jgi:hypothetical protein
MTPAERDESFVCPKLHSTISRGDCAARHVRYASRAASTNGVAGCCCSVCPIGAEHARGVRALHVQLAVIVPKPSRRSYRPHLCVGCGLPVPQPSVPRRDRMWGAQLRNVCGPSCASLARSFEGQTFELQLPEWA